jgi:hypothetical protein
MALTAMETLRDFISSAERSRKYPPNTAKAFNNALKLFEAVLNEEEAGSTEAFSERLDQIYHAVFEKNKNRMSVGSLATYKARVNRVLSDYESYGSDPTKFASWSPTIKPRAPRKSSSVKTTAQNQDTASENFEVFGTATGSMAPPRTLPSGIVVIFPKNLDSHATFGDFGSELRALDVKAGQFTEDGSHEEAEDSN